MKKNFPKAFSLIEVMMVIAVIGILSSIVLVSLSGARQKAKDKAVFMQIVPTHSIAYKCIRSGFTNSIGIPSAFLVNPNNDTELASYFCAYHNGVSRVGVAGFPDWPVISSSNGWTYTSNFFRCPTDYTGSIAPTDCGGYNGTTCGSNPVTGKFCYFLRKTAAGPFIYCTESGCKYCLTTSSACTNTP